MATNDNFAVVQRLTSSIPKLPSVDRFEMVYEQ